jgi:hypothetical protein
LVIAAGVAQARPVHSYVFGYNSNANRYRTRWSIYTHGLISGDLYYSPYVPAGHGGSRLVYSDVRYSPYAFGHGQSGLVSDTGSSYVYGLAPAYYRAIHHAAPVQARSQLSGAPKTYGHSTRVKAQRTYRETVEDRKARRAALAKAREKRNAIRANDGKEIIAEYLKGRNIDFRVTRILSIEGRTVSVDFLLNDGKTILKYWNPGEIPSTAQPQQRKRKFFDKYLESCEVYLADHLRAGGNVHQIISSDRAEILAKLPQCPDLNGIAKVYAVAQD